MRRSAPAVLVTVLAVTAIPVAQAAHPIVKDKTIVIGKSIAGVKVGASPAAAKKAWGASGGLCDPAGCLYRVKGDTNGTSGEGTFSFPGGKVTGVELKAPIARRGRSYKPPFTTPRTSKGIGIGSTPAQVRKAYPKAKTTANFITIDGAGGVQTTFTYETDNNRVFSIIIERRSSD